MCVPIRKSFGRGCWQRWGGARNAVRLPAAWVSAQFVYGVRDRLVLGNQRSSYRVGGYRESVIAEMQPMISDWIKAEPDLTLQQLCDRLAVQGRELKVPALWHQLNKWGLSLKKTLHASEQERADVQQARHEWRTLQPTLNAARLVFLGETWASTSMARRYGRAPKGQRCVAARAPWALEDHHLHRRTAPEWPDGAPGGRWPYGRGNIPGLCTGLSVSDTQTWRHRHRRQPRQP